MVEETEVVEMVVEEKAEEVKEVVQSILTNAKYHFRSQPKFQDIFHPASHL